MTTTRITKLYTVLLTSAAIVLSSIAAAQLFVSDNNAAFAAINCEVTDTDGTIEETCVGGTSIHAEFTGGEGARSTCTSDSSTPDAFECIASGGMGGTFEDDDGLHAGGGGGRSDCTFNPDAGETICSLQVGGGGSKPVPDEGG